MVYKAGILGEPDNLNPLAGWSKDIGLRIKLSTVDDGALTDQMYATRNGALNLDYDMFLWGRYSDLDPSSILGYFITGQINSWSDCAWSDAEYDKLFVEQNRTIAPTARKAIIDMMQEIIYRESPYIVTASEESGGSSAGLWVAVVAADQIPRQLRAPDVASPHRRGVV